MAVDAPVLERKIASEKQAEAEELHNSRIRENYARLINPNNRIDDVFAAFEASFAQPAAPVREERPYLVENARADSALFRADSAINARTTVSEVAATAEETVMEEESEDARPTSTTLQYKTVGRADSESKINSVTDTRKHFFTSKEKIILGIIVAVVVALVTLIIVNSAVINNLDNEIANVQEKINTVRGAIAGVNSTIEDILHAGLSK